MDEDLNLQPSGQLIELNSTRANLTNKCLVCQRVADFVIAGERHRQLSLGNWQGFLERKHCVCCQTIVRCLAASSKDIGKLKPSCPFIFKEMINCYWIIADDDREPLEHISDGLILLLIRKEVQKEGHPQYNPIHSTRMDISELVRKWSTYCNQKHEGSCHDLPDWQKLPPASSLILIDVQNYCLIQTIGYVNTKYVALSYVWGQISETLELKSENLITLCVKGSFGKAEFSSQIPNTILDAMTLTRQMGLRYLWVDRLCIIQDTPTHMTTQLQQMASIYANSYFTIIAADGFDAGHGLRGVDPHHPTRDNVETSFNFADNVTMIQKPKQESSLLKPLWNTRGWTFQERAVSRRNLVFTKDTIYWECRSNTWYRNILGEPDGASSLLKPDPASSKWPSYALNTNPWPDLEQYFGFVRGYNSRNLTFESDALNAFTAIINVMSKSFPGGFHFGLPNFLFDIGMLWTNDSWLKRRSEFPSWSWLGWTGDVYLDHSYSNAWNPSFGGINYNARIKNLVEWYASNKDGISRHPIDNSYFLYQLGTDESFSTLPNGWNKTWNHAYGQRAVQHESLPYLFKYPFPILPPVKVDSSSSLSCFLEFEADACILFLGALYPRYELYKSLLAIDLLESRSLWSGVIEPLYASDDQYQRGKPCDLIAISEGWATRLKSDEFFTFTEVAFDEMDKQQAIREEYAFYNVLWVDWIDGVAYRKGQGRVWKKMWALQNPKRVSVKLG